MFYMGAIYNEYNSVQPVDFQINYCFKQATTIALKVHYEILYDVTSVDVLRKY